MYMAGHFDEANGDISKAVWGTPSNLNKKFKVREVSHMYAQGWPSPYSTRCCRANGRAIVDDLRAAKMNTTADLVGRRIVKEIAGGPGLLKPSQMGSRASTWRLRGCGTSPASRVRQML